LTKEQGEVAKVDAEVRLRGICFYQVTKTRQAVRPILSVGRNETVVVLSPAPGDPYAMPAESINSLTKFNPKGLRGHRVHVSGVVTYAESESSFWIRDAGQGLRVRSSMRRLLAPGDKLDVLGFVTRDGFSPALDDAVFRVVGHTAPPPPTFLTTSSQALDRDGDLISLEAVIQEQWLALDGCRLKLVAGTNGFSALWHDANENRRPEDWQPGSRVRVTGICQVDAGAPNLVPGTMEPQSFEVNLRSPVDVLILQAAPWWTPEHTSWALGFTLVAVLVVSTTVFWIYRRRAARRLAAVRAREALAEERARIARDLHDDLGANLAEMAMISELAREVLPARDPSRNQFDDIFNRAEANTRRLGEIVWALNPANDTLENFAAYLCNFAQDYITHAGLQCRLDLPETFPAGVLTSNQRHHLLLSTKEAIHNAIQHGKPKTITIRLVLHDGQFEITVHDDGRGIDATKAEIPSRGSANMQMRIKSIGGTFKRQSDPSCGTTVTLNIPFSA
jgi:signal transduction histidine kinase